MSKRFLASVLFASLLLSGCGSSSVGATPSVQSATHAAAASASLQRIVDEGWAGVVKGRADFRGSLVLHIESAAGQYTVSSGDPVSDPENVKVRVASNAKNYTAAAIMLLAQEGRLNLYHAVSNYLPDTADYCIKFPIATPSPSASCWVTGAVFLT